MFFNSLKQIGSTTYHSFTEAVTLSQIMHQSGENPEQVLFRNILLRLRDGKTTTSDWE